MKRSKTKSRRRWTTTGAASLIALFVNETMVSRAHGATGNGREEFSLAATGLAFGGSGGGIGIAPGYHLPVLSWLQASFTLSYQTLTFASTSVKQVVFSVGPTFNIGLYPAAFFIFPALTFRSGSGTTPLADGDLEPTGTGISLTVGKKFPLGTSISWRPSVAMLNGAAGSTFVLTPAAISYYF